MKISLTLILLILSNAFMTMAWYGHLKYQSTGLNNWKALMGIVLVSWGIAFFEYCLQVPANRLGFIENGGPFSLIQLKILQEVITLTVFVIFTVLLFKNETFSKNHIISFVFIILAVYFAFKK
ncbi:MAG: DMT family protein [Saprospiraceae bacterium]|nr:DMT family protein [Saprospiraceae bacterium]MBK7812371.1 DMT family protein [Saprospiraceae bacterium]MBK9632405.1 DMT family protein [Saprospiraceae bacterium]